MFNREKLPYRKATIGVVKNSSGQFFLIQKLSYQDDQWNFPGGGIDEGESAGQAIERELNEELGTNKFKVLAQSKLDSSYDWPDHIIKLQFNKHGKWWRGQQIVTFLVEFTGEKSDIHFQKEEIKDSRWVQPQDLKNYLVFPNQYETTEKVLQEWNLLK